MSDLLGFTSIALVFMLTFFAGSLRPNISKILFVALIIRVLVMLIGHYLVTLPDSTADAMSFEREAWSIAQGGFFNVIDNYIGPDAKFISWLIAIPYSLFGRSILLAKSITLFFGMGSVFLGWLLAKKIWNNNIANKVGWAIALFPSLILYSVLVLREAYIAFFLLLALYGIAGWIKNDEYKSIVLALIGFTGATFFHGALMVGGLVFLIIVGVVKLKQFLKLLTNLKINIESIILIILISIFLQNYLSNKINVPYLGNFAASTNIERIFSKTQGATRGVASWPEWTKISSPIEFLYKAPVRSIYIVLAPFPWDVKKTKHLIGMLDAFLYAYLTFLILFNIKFIWKDPFLRIVLIILLTYLLVFGIGVGNFGTGVRHRSKFVIMFILLAAPILRSFTLYKKNSNN
jgi:4-amino-4-deoxy-L-arabinose transferase-like glycosyltransferase